jgi:predicted GNAT family N-acyltransferase
METSDFEVREIEFGSAAYVTYTALRDQVLRQPLGLTFSEVDLEKEPGYRHFGLFSAEQILATVMIVPTDATVAKVRQMAVAFNYQGRGLGQQLLTAVEQRLFRDGIGHLYLHARDSAVGFYQRLGYSVVGDPFTEVGIPHRKMEKALALR